MKQLIVDYLPFEVEPKQITESMHTNGGKLIVRGVLQRAEAKNQNGRIYPREILVREAKKYTKEFIKQRRAMGELDHPESSVINLQNVSHNVVKIKMVGDDVYGEVEILSTPAGNILKELFRNGITVGISSRGMGSVKELSEGTLEVEDDFELLCWDFVSTPSNPDSFMHLVTEGLDFSTQTNYTKVNSIITEILCAKGFCPIK